MTLVIDAAPLVALADGTPTSTSGSPDLSVAVLAGRLRTRRILTYDQRYFRAVRPIQGGAFTLLPADH